MTVKNLTLWLAIALTTLATTSCSDSSGSLFDGTEAMPINMNNLTGKWIAVFAVGTDANGQRVSESDMSGISTLDIVPLLILNSDNTFKAYSPAWKNNTDYVWAKGTTFFTTGEGSVMLIGSRLQLAQTAPKNAVACDIVSLTRTQLICQYAINGSNIQCTYQRTDIDVNAYDSDTQREPSLYVDGDNMSGTWLALKGVGTTMK